MAKTTMKDSGSKKPPSGDKPPRKNPGAKGSAVPAPAPGAMGQANTWWANFVRYLKSVRSEMKRITWPGKDQLRAYTIVVLLTLIFVTLFLFICDWTFTQIFHRIVSY